MSQNQASKRIPNRNPLPQLIPQRLRRIKQHVGERIWRAEQDVSLSYSPAAVGDITPQQAAELGYQPLHPGDYIGPSSGSWEHIWMRFEIPAASAEEKGNRYFKWKCQGETTAWINGRAWAGLDVAHRYCPLPDEACTVYLECCLWQTAIWLDWPDNEPITPYGVRFDGAQIAVRSEAGWKCHCDLDAISQMMEEMLKGEDDLRLEEGVGYCRALEKVAPRSRMVLAELDKLCDAYQDVALEEGNLEALSEANDTFFAKFPAESWQPKASICGHAHIDLVWLWPESATDKKIVHSFATVMRLMERYPEKTFVQSMPALYRSLERNNPGLLEEIKEHIDTERWEVMGAFEVEPDNNLPGGEALARSIAVGQAYTKRLQGRHTEVAWIPDVFGYSQCLPQVMALGGVKYFYTTKMTWSCITKFPYNSFTWRGADGTEVLAHLASVNYNGEIKLDMQVQAMDEHRQVAEHPDMLLPQGFGDGGGGPTDLICERARRFADLSGSPRAEWTTSEKFFEAMEDVREDLPVYQGELYLEYHRGTYTSQSEFKRHYRRCESSLQAREAVHVALGRAPLAEEDWVRPLFAHFHDAIPGSSIREVYEEMNPELEGIADKQWALAEETLAAEGDEVAFNPLPFAHTQVVEQANGELSQVRYGALEAVTPGKGEVINSISEAANTRLSNGLVDAHFNERGELAELTVRGEKLALSQSAGFVLSVDDPALFDAWDIDHHGVKRGTDIPVGPLKVVENSSLRGVLESEPTSFGSASKLSVRYVLDAGSDHLRIEPTVDWHETHKMLRYYAPTDYLGRNARFGCPFGSIARPQLSGVEADEAMWEVPGSRWAAVHHDFAGAGAAQGLAICAESKLGYAARDGVLSLTLLRSPKNPDEICDMGEHTMPFALGAYRTTTEGELLSTPMAADALFAKPLMVSGGERKALVSFENLQTLAPSWIAPSQTLGDKGYFVRLHESQGAPGEAVLRFAQAPKSAKLVNFLEEEMAPLEVEADGSVRVPYTPYQILTVLVEA